MNMVFLNDDQRKQIVDLVNPKANDYFSYQNLNLLTAVYDEEKKIYLTLAYYMSNLINRTGDNSNDYSYIMLSPMGDYFVGCIEKSGKYSGVFSPLPMYISNEKILEMIMYYKHSIRERLNMITEIEKKIDLGGKGFTEWYLENNYFNLN